MREHALRLTYGQDLKKEIEYYCQKNKLQSVCIVTCVGCVYDCHLRLADGVTKKIFDHHYEIVSLTGTIANGQSHIHISCSDIDGNCIGGHLLEDTHINTTAEIVLLELETVEFTREFDGNTGYDELVIKHK